jgi:putative endonuclease
MLRHRSRTRLRLIIHFNKPGTMLRFSKTIRIMPRSAYVYILASGRYGTLYIGVTSDLIKRIWQHREGLAEGFTKRHQVKYLVWYEVHGDIMAAITREKQLKEWRRAWKLELIHEHNPLWRDLYLDLV